MNNYGQKVKLEVYEEETNRLLFSTSDHELRIDFHLLSQSGFDRSKITIYNLNKNTVKALTNGRHIVYIWTSLHGSPYELVINEHTITNALNYIKLPNNITELYCYDTLHDTFLQKKLEIQGLVNPTTKRCINSILSNTGTNISLSTKDFPSELEDEVLDSRIKRSFFRSTKEELDILARERKFNYFIRKGELILIYKLNSKTEKDSELTVNKADITLDPNKMKGNPEVGVAQFRGVVNLRPEIQTTLSIDTSDLITAESSDNFNTLTTATEILRASVTGYSKYRLITVEHKGSNYTNLWETTLYGVGVQKGTNGQTFGWFGQTETK